MKLLQHPACNSRVPYSKKQIKIYEIATEALALNPQRTYGVFHMTTKKQLFTYEIITIQIQFAERVNC